MNESPIKIGLVEDDPLDVRLLQIMLNKPPKIVHELYQSFSLGEALSLLKNETLDVMLLDLGLPDAQGLEVFHQVKSYAPNLPIIIFSGQDDKDIALRAVAEGAQDYLVKGKTNAHTIKRTILHAIERQRATQEQLVRATFSSAANGIATTRPDGKFILTNPAYSRMVGYSEAELSTLNLYELIHPDDRVRNLGLTGQLLAGKIDNFGVEERYVKKDGAIVWIRASASLERSADGQPLSIVTVSEDITERKQAEDALREREEQLRLYAEHSPAAIAMVDRDMKYMVVSRRWMDDYRLGDQPIIGRSHYEVFPEIPQRWIEIHQRCLAGAIEKSEEDSFSRADGSTDWIRWEVRPWHLAGGSIGGLILFSEDITARKQGDALLQESESRTRAILDSALDAVIGMDDQGRITDWNPRAETIFGWSKDEVLGLELADMIIPEQHREAHRRGLARFLTTGEERVLNQRIEITALRRNGEEFSIEMAVTLLKTGNTHYFTAFISDISERKQSELERQEVDKRLRDQASLLDKAQDAIVVRGLDNCIQFWNKGAERLYGWTAAEVLGTSTEKLLYDDPADFYEAARQVIEFGEWSGEIKQLRKDGSLITVEAHWNLVRDDNEQPYSILAINTDVSQRKAAEERIERLAFYDNLTGLANRSLLVDRLQLALAVCAREKQMGALLFIDLDNFKALNDTLGHDMGDLLLQQVAHRLVGCVRESDTVARLGGDEFVVMLEEMSGVPQEAATQAKTVGEKILATFNQPFQLIGNEHYTTPSIGVTLFSDQQNTVEELLKRADIAMYQAKASGRNVMRFFDPEMQAVISARVVLETDLHVALQQSEFLLYYQPQLDSTGRIMGAEALVRWQHPKLGLVPPVKFIPAAEETGLILILGHWVLEAACNQLAVWAAKPETARLTLSVNVSARQFRQPDFVEQVLAVVDYTKANPERLKLELTESLLADNTEDIIAKMIALKAKGIGFSLDDFGIGYSSLSYLKRLPLDQLKIDQSFVRDILTDPNDAAIACTILALGKSLGMTVVAEGVETKEQYDFLVKQECHVYQGYYFSRPVPIAQFEEYRLTMKKTAKEKKAKTKK